jgi:hypothetical protein
MTTFNKLEEISEIFIDFTKLFASYICSRCDRSAVSKLKEVGGSPVSHHNGFINKFLMGTQPNKDRLDNYFHDLEHGFLHGFMTCFVAYYVNRLHSEIIPPNKILGVLDRVFATALLHDYLKTSGEEAGHDKNLRSHFPYLLPEAYSHENPPKEHERTHLVVADRVELMRFPDYKEWVDKRFYNILNALSEEERAPLKFFYTHIRPALEYIYTNRNDIWIRHGIEVLEKRDYTKGAEFPPDDSFQAVMPYKSRIVRNWYPIEHDSVPFIKRLSGQQIWNCSTHGNYRTTWNRLKGFIPFQVFHDLGGRIKSPERRDHLYAENKTPLSEWLFTYKKIEGREEEVCEILEAGTKGIVSEDLLFYFFGAIKLFQERMSVLNIENGVTDEPGFWMRG